MNELLLTLAILHGADAATTQMAFARGAREGNPLMPSGPVANLAVKAGLAGASMYLIARVNRTHPRVAKTLAGISIGIESAAVGANIRLTIELGRKK